MPFVHSLVKREVKGRTGWCAPIELGEATPHYISFVLPLDEKGELGSSYICETIRTEDGEKIIQSQQLVQQGEDAFVLGLDRIELWFTLRPAAREDRRLPYIGKLQHADFAFLFVEIEPQDANRLDKLYEESNTFVIGCEPFRHYAGAATLRKKH